MKFAYGHHGDSSNSQWYNDGTDSIFTAGQHLALTFMLLLIGPEDFVERWWISFDEKPMVRDYTRGYRSYFMSGWNDFFCG